MQQFTYLGRVWNVLNFFLKKKDIIVKKINIFVKDFMLLANSGLQ
jgi:hypothetical protein